MIIQFDRDYVVEAIRHDESQSLYEHFKNDCGWSDSKISEIEHYDFYAVEVKATGKQGNSNSEYLGCCCSESFEEDIKSGMDGYLQQLIDDAVKGLFIV